MIFHGILIRFPTKTDSVGNRHKTTYFFFFFEITPKTTLPAMAIAATTQTTIANGEIGDSTPRSFTALITVSNIFFLPFLFFLLYFGTFDPFYFRFFIETTTIPMTAPTITTPAAISTIIRLLFREAKLSEFIACAGGALCV